MPGPSTRADSSDVGKAAQTAGPATTPEQSVRSAQHKIRSKLDARTTGLEGLVDQFTRSFGVSREKTSQLTGQMSRNMEMANEVGTVIARGYQEVSREWLELAQARLQNYVDHMAALVRCGSVQEVIATQQKIAEDLIREFSENGTRIAKVAGRIVEEAREAMAGKTDGKTGRVTEN
jgi:hypothetical protein